MEFGTSASYEDLKTRFDVIYLAFGLAASPLLGIPGEEHIVDGLALLSRARWIRRVWVGRNVVVIGAGNTAVDCATVAKVWRDTGHDGLSPDRPEMTTYPHEYDFVRKEGSSFASSRSPSVCAWRGDVTAVECVCMELSDPDHTGAPSRPVFGSEFAIEADQVVKSIGQENSACKADGPGHGADTSK